MTLTARTLLIDAMSRVLEDLNVECGQFEILDGLLSQIDYCYPALGNGPSEIVSYSDTFSSSVPARLIAGSATVGFRQGRRFAHCHATWFDANGTVRGGHILPTTVIGENPIRAIVHALDDVETVSSIDAESGLPAFSPRRRRSQLPTLAGSHRAVLARLAPGVVVDSAIREIMQEEGYRRASIAGSLGSLVGAVFHRSGNYFVVDGPATEVTLIGEYDLTDARKPISHLSGFAIDRHGSVHVGEFVKEESIVACTLELLVRESAS